MVQTVHLSLPFTTLPLPKPVHHVSDASASQSHRRLLAILTARRRGQLRSAVSGASRKTEIKDLLSIAPSSSHKTVIPYPSAAEPEARGLLTHHHHHSPVREIAGYIIAYRISSREACTSQRQLGRNTAQRQASSPTAIGPSRYRKSSTTPPSNLTSPRPHTTSRPVVSG